MPAPVNGKKEGRSEVPGRPEATRKTPFRGIDMTYKKLTRTAPLALAALLSLFLGLQLAFAGLESGARQDQKPNRYVGAAKCKNCHRSDEAGNQFEAWESSEHSHAFEVLASPESLAAAKERNIENPQESPECLRCHVTGYGEPEDHFRKGFEMEAGVQCESCHGPGENHMKARLMAAAAAARDPDAKQDEYVQVPEDEIISDVGQQVCLECHNEESPTFKPFCYYERKAEIRHLNPLKPRTDEERAALLVCGCGDDCECVHGSVEGCGVPPKKEDAEKDD